MTITFFDSFANFTKVIEHEKTRHFCKIHKILRICQKKSYSHYKNSSNFRRHWKKHGPLWFFIKKSPKTGLKPKPICFWATANFFLNTLLYRKVQACVNPKFLVVYSSDMRYSRSWSLWRSGLVIESARQVIDLHLTTHNSFMWSNFAFAHNLFLFDLLCLRFIMAKSICFWWFMRGGSFCFITV